MIPELIGIAVLIGLALKGKPGRLAEAPVKQFWIIYAVAAVYVAAGIANWLTGYSTHAWIFEVVAAAGVVGPLVFAFLNRRIPGAEFVILGLVLDLVASLANGGFNMPVWRKAAVIVWGENAVRRMAEHSYIHHVFMTPGTRLGLLCDIIPAPWPPFLIKSVYSIGDVILSVGIGIAVVTIMRTPAKSGDR